MKNLALGLFLLVLMEFVFAQNSSSAVNTTMTSNETTYTTQPYTASTASTATTATAATAATTATAATAATTAATIGTTVTLENRLSLISMSIPLLGVSLRKATGTLPKVPDNFMYISGASLSCLTVKMLPLGLYTLLLLTLVKVEAMTTSMTPVAPTATSSPTTTTTVASTTATSSPTTTTTVAPTTATSSPTSTTPVVNNCSWFPTTTTTVAPTTATSSPTTTTTAPTTATSSQPLLQPWPQQLQLVPQPTTPVANNCS
ncbi:hypothetical protein JOB18_005032 [Solea senegalensis]|uniref:Uncharacterized protein n=1 Tax=Solea senegalensis TaxID=28829 RepID=A0AAV6R6C1_SOLSE|nr:hypothetical protein JOB18_005032 [Solea senegalensis]